MTTTTTTVDTPGTLKSTSSYPQRQAIDECGDICYPSSVPNGTTLSNCTLSFTGLIAGAWYAVSIQVNMMIFSFREPPCCENYTSISTIKTALDELFSLRLASLDLKICPYHMTFLIKILKFFMGWQKKVRLGRQ
jgi:hypothetical protein